MKTGPDVVTIVHGVRGVPDADGLGLGLGVLPGVPDGLGFGLGVPDGLGLGVLPGVPEVVGVGLGVGVIVVVMHV